MIEQEFWDRFHGATFALGSRTWRVEVGEWKGRWVGKCSDSKMRIRLNRTRIKTEDELIHTFYHELVHAIGVTMGWPALWKDEMKVDAIGNMLAQVEATITWGR